MTRRWIPTLALIAATAVLTATVQSTLFAPPSHAAGAGWEYAELTQDPTQVVYRRADKQVSVATDVVRPGDDVWRDLAKNANVLVGEDNSHIGFLNALGKDGWEVFDVSTRSWTTAATGVKVWSLRRQR